jgi:hypothetical protein
MVHPFSPDWHVGGTVLVSGRQGSIVELPPSSRLPVIPVEEKCQISGCHYQTSSLTPAHRSCRNGPH